MSKAEKMGVNRKGKGCAGKQVVELGCPAAGLDSLARHGPEAPDSQSSANPKPGQAEYWGY